MPNGGTDNCGMCPFVLDLGSSSARCGIRDVELEAPLWTYCANHPKHNPFLVEHPVGPVYEDAGEYPYRRVVLYPSPPDDDVGARLELLDQVIDGELASSSRTFQVALVEDLGKLESGDAVPRLVDLAMAEPGDMKLVANPDTEPGVVDLGDMWESDAARVEFVRLAALRALRRIYNANVEDTAMELLSSRFESGTPDERRRAHVAMAFIAAYIEPP